MSIGEEVHLGGVNNLSKIFLPVTSGLVASASFLIS